MPQIIIELDVYNRLIEMEKSYNKNEIWIDCERYFTGGPGGVYKSKVELYSKSGIPETIVDFNKEINSLKKEISDLYDENWQLKKKTKKSFF